MRALSLLLAVLGSVAACAKTGLDRETSCGCVIGTCDPYGRCVECLADQDCDDGLDCTSDRCNEGLCERRAEPSLCATGLCDTRLGCVECESDSECSDEQDCTVDRCVNGGCSSRPTSDLCPTGLCSLGLGCVECLLDADCDDGVTCSTDACLSGVCVNEPDHSRCEGELCDVTLGCVECRGSEDCHDSLTCTRAACQSHECVFTPYDEDCPPQLRCDEERGCVNCLDDTECNDSISCTTDRCIDGACVNEPDDSVCVTGQSCDLELDCVECLRDEDCHDGLACNGAETCSDSNVCLPSIEVVCDDGIACTVDVCNDASGDCFADPDDSLCPNGQLCSPFLGCTSRPWLWAQSASALWIIDLENTPPTATEVGPFDTTASLGITDIAEISDGRLFGVTYSALYSIDPSTGAATLVGTLESGGNGLTAAPDGTLYVAGSSLARVDPTTAATDVVGTFPAGISSSGDIVWGPFGAIFMSDTQPEGDRLVSMDPLTAAATPLGFTEFQGVYGLSYRQGKLLGLTAGGALIELDPLTGAGTLVHNLGVPWWGGS